MDVLDWLRSLRRQWFVALLMVLITAGAVYGTTILVTPRYETSGTLLLLGPNSYVDVDGQDVAINPFARYGGSGEAVTAATLVAVLMSPSSLREAEEGGFPGEYVVSNSPFVAGAIDIVVTSDTPEDSLEGLGMVIDDLQDRLLESQVEAGAPESSLIGSSVLTRSEEAQSLDGAQLRAMAVTAALGVALAVLLARGVDLARRRRRSHRSSGGVPRPGLTPSEAVDPDGPPLQQWEIDDSSLEPGLSRR